MLEACDSRSNEWGLTAKGQIDYVSRDQHIADFIIIQVVEIFVFWTFKFVPIELQNAPDIKRRNSGRPEDEDKYDRESSPDGFAGLFSC
ncbi:hypothetical protein DPMN_171091 [Dreissena polymorpha]|uniref:Uncharacterized protein n=1 Tax=Dreissena polymorpha TaxID=45954 RepID=A0A9D4E0L5_DREPO|nr:hypothetical protein DPMN_171091 [Dreissena polymorpha]